MFWFLLQFAAAVSTVRFDPAVRVVVIRSAVPGIFCAGKCLDLYTPFRGGSRILKKGGPVDRVAVVRGRSPSPARGFWKILKIPENSGPLENFGHLESLKCHFLHSEEAKCLILQFANNKI